VAELLPLFLTRARRGLCPTCGAPLPLEDSDRLVTCGFCGGAAMLERRLRKIDADVALPELSSSSGAADVRSLAQALGPARAERLPCPGCGDALEGSLAHEVLTCGSCGTQSKVERRMVRPAAQPRTAPRRRTRAEFQAQRGSATPGWDVETEQLCWRVLNEPVFEKQVALAQLFERWSYINATAVYFLPHLVQLAKQSPLALAHPLCDCVGKLLCQDDASLVAPTLEACEPFALDPTGSSELLHEIGLGSARGLKLLIAAADAASRAGRLEYASHALWAAHAIIERNFSEHPIIAEILLYRLLYVSPLVLGWMLYEMASGYGGYVFKDPIPLLEFIDDCAFERPDLVAPLTACVRTSWAKGADELSARLRFAAARLSKAGQAAALIALGTIDGDAPPDAYAVGVEFVEPWLDDPERRDAAILILRRYVSVPAQLLPAVTALVQRRGEALPDLIKREVHWKDPQTRLLDRARCDFGDGRGDPEPAFAPAVRAAREAYDHGIRAAVDARQAEQEKCRELWQQSRRLDLPLYLEN
jgi:hypothetical protein